MRHIYLFILILQVSCVSIDKPQYLFDYFNPEIDTVYVEKHNDKFRIIVILKKYSINTNPVSDTSLVVDGVSYKLKGTGNSSKLVSQPFSVRDNYIDIKLKLRTTLGVNNPLSYNNVIVVNDALGTVKNRNKPKYLPKGTVSSGFENKSYYNSSKAILIGINTISSEFPDLPYVNNDIKKLKKSLINNNFEVSILLDSVTTNKLKNKLYNFINSSGKNDRLIIYISSHGFPDKQLSNQGYIATSNCKKSSAFSTCLPLNYFNRISSLAKRKSVKHLLIVVDSCFSGIGIIDKAGKTNRPIEAVAYSSGIHMLTAGRSNQIARMEHELKMSTFTYFLIKGLNGSADLSGGYNYKKDGIITLSELFTYVNHTVVERTNGTQIPSLGRIFGEGEMIFQMK